MLPTPMFGRRYDFRILLATLILSGASTHAQSLVNPTVIAHNVHTSKTGAANSTAIEAAFASVSTGSAVRISLPCGTYQFARQIDVIRPAIIEGGGGAPNNGCTKLVFPAGSHGIYLHSYTTFSGTGTDRSDSTQIRNIWIHADAKSTVRHGIVMRSPAYLDEVYVDGFAGDGVNLHASLPAASTSLTSLRRVWSVTNGVTRAVGSSGVEGTTLTVNTSAAHNLAVGDIIWVHRGTTETNPDVQRRVVASVSDADTFTVNLWTTDNNGNVWSTFTPTEIRTGSGFYTAGGDSSAILFESCASYHNEAWGNADIGFLGNTHIAELADGNEIGAYFSPLATSPTAWIGCYSEATNPYSFINSPSVVIGGDHGSPVFGSHVGNVWGRYTRMPVLVKDLAGVEIGQTVLGSTPDANPTHLQFIVDGDAFPYNFIWDYSSAQLGGWDATLAAFNYSYGAGAGFLVTTPTTTWPNGRVAVSGNAGRLAFTSGFYFNSGSYRGEASAVPSTGKWIRGDTIFHNSPAVNSPLGWVCTASGDFAGTPPTFVTLFGPTGSDITVGKLTANADGIAVDYTDSTGSPGNATINKTSGSSAMASGASTVVITSSKASATSRVFYSHTNSNAACVGSPWVVTKAAGSFTLTAVAACTVAAATFDWWLVN